MPTNLKSCSNCEQQFYESYAFCPYCGQKSKQELTLGVLFNNTISNYFSVDARFFKSFVPLMAKPGYLASRFIEGKRLLYLHPAQMYLFISVVFFFLFGFVARDTTQSIDSALKKQMSRSKTYFQQQRDSLQRQRDSISVVELANGIKNNKDKLGLTDKDINTLDSVMTTTTQDDKALSVNYGFNERKIDSLISIGATDEVIYQEMGMDEDDGWLTKKLYAQALRFFKNSSGGSILQAFFDSIPIAMFVLLPIFALLLKLFYFRRGRFAHHLVFGFYYFSFLFMVFSLILLINYIWDMPSSIEWLIALSTFFTCSWR